MARLIVTEFVTLDGVMEAPGGEPTHPHAGWVGDYHDEGTLEYKLNEALEAESHLLGRVTYESFAGAWPKREGQFAEKINAMPKYVVSSTLRDPAWNNTHVLTGGGLRVFPESGQKKPFELTGTRTFGSGVVVNAYERAER